jgi:hypothetical protein
MSLIESLRRVKAFLDPRGPLGEVLSPADVYKERAGLPIATPHVARDLDFHPVDPAMLRAPYFVDARNIGDVPKSRMRVASRYIEEHFTPVYETPRFSGMAEAIRANTTVLGWWVEERARSPHCDCLQAKLEMRDGKLTHVACGRARAHISDQDFVEHIQHLQFAPSDDFYNTYYPTIPGNDPVVLNGKVLKGAPKYDAQGRVVHDGTVRGGTQMRGGRAEYRHRTKGMALWDKGFVKERDAAYAASQKKWIDGVRPRLFKADKQMLPRKLGQL